MTYYFHVRIGKGRTGCGKQMNQYTKTLPLGVTKVYVDCAKCREFNDNWIKYPIDLDKKKY